MTENRDRAIGLLLMRAARIANFDAAQGWPDALTLDELAALQYPEEGAASGMGMGPSHDRPNQTDFCGLLAIFAKQAAATVKVDRPMPGAMDDKWPCDALERPALKGILQSAGLLPSELVGAWLGTDWQATPSPAKDGRQTGKQEEQIQTIEATARTLKYDPLDIPDGGRAAIKAHCLEHHFGLFTESGFDHAWKAANRQDRIRIHMKERYIAR